MKTYSAKDIRNIAIVGHNSVGKTLLTELSLLLVSFKITDSTVLNS